MHFSWFVFLAMWGAAVSDSLPEFRERGAALESNRQWEQAEALYKYALDRLGPDGSRQDRFWLLTSLAEMSFERHDYRQARGWLRKAEEAIIAFGPATRERARLLNAWGTLYLVEGNLSAAEEKLSQAVALLEPLGAAADLAAALHNLAGVDMHTGHLERAELNEKKALALWREHFGERHYYVMKACISLSSLQGYRGDWHAAERSIQQALSIARTPEALANYATVLDKLKHRREAREIRRRLQVEKITASPLVDVGEMAHEAGRPGLRTQ